MEISHQWATWATLSFGVTKDSCAIYLKRHQGGKLTEKQATATKKNVSNGSQHAAKSS